MTDSFPRQEARTRRFSLGVPRSFRISPDGRRVVFLRTTSGTDPVTCLWVLDVISGRERLAADPRTLGPYREGTDEDNLPAAERARRERVRESAGGIVAYATDRDVTLAVFALSGQVFKVPLTGDGAPARAVTTLTPALDPRSDPTGRQLAYVCAGALRVTSLDGGGEDVAIADPHGAAGVTFGLPEFIAAEEMDRQRGYWWSPDGLALLVARADETPVTRWYIADPAHPERTPAEVAYPAAGTPNAEVSLLLARLDGSHRPVETGGAEFPYLVTVSWADESEPLIVVQSRDQRRMRLLALDLGTGQTRVLLEDTDPHWLEIVPGVPARLPGGRIVWARDEADTRRLIVLAPDQEPVAVTPPGLQVRGVLDVDGEVVLFSASAEPTEVELWTFGPGGQDQVAQDQVAQHESAQDQVALARAGQGGGVEGGTRAGGTTVTWRRALDADGVTVTVHRDGQLVATIATHAERPLLPEPRPVLLSAGPREIRTAVLFPSWHQRGQYQPGQAKLPVLLDPYGGPHAQRVLKARGAYLTSQWFAEQGFAVVVADGRGTPARGPEWERAVAGDLAGPPLADQIDALQAAAERFGDLDTGRVAIRGWSFGGYLAALAVLRRPDIFHAAVAGAPVTDWHLYDTHYTERYLGLPDGDGDDYDRCSLLSLLPSGAERSGVTARPVLLIHGLADDNVVVAHTLRLSGALLAAGYPHSVLPLTGITHMASQETVAENLLTLQLDFLRGALGIPEPV